ncbi:LPPG:FO 2-phospho-L-lactate transferase [Kribbella voronezhensis]|uniref:LPPG:FO 2-phospho-L-lactate transferase n=1 Tax=Kribbella voronezhensis TaxID=2512212 RepID=A0A4R7T928_9ACTN|nr:2-phospho-L-lactate transferase [Kribbella voronezhensis]TDU88472.1 LPPG:FO 2-phospho-L-lactate transferase [Kribbella voronezhensis]
MRLTVLAGGVGGSTFLRGLLAARPDAEITVVGNTADDITLFGLRVCPDLDTVMYTLGGGISKERGWGREDETWVVKEELAAYGVEPTWFGLGDRDIATHLVRTQMLDAGYGLAAVTEALCARWELPVRLLPMSDDRVETHVVVDDPENPGTRKAIHFQEYWVRLHAEVPAHQILAIGQDKAKPAPGVLDAIAECDALILPPSNPVVSVGTILGVPGIREAVRETAAPVIGVSPIIGTGPVRGMADKVLAAIGVESTAGAVARYYGSRAAGGVLDGWLIDTSDAAQLESIAAAGIHAQAVPLWMDDEPKTAAIATAAVVLAEAVRR